MIQPDRSYFSEQFNGSVWGPFAPSLRRHKKDPSTGHESVAGGGERTPQKAPFKPHAGPSRIQPAREAIVEQNPATTIADTIASKRWRMY